MRTGPNIHLRKDGRWEARYQKGRDATGRIIYGFVYGETQDEATRKRSELLSKAGQGEYSTESILATLNPNISVPEITKYRNTTVKSKLPKYVEPFSDEEALVLEHYLKSVITPVHLCYYLSLHLGLSTNEFCAVKYSDIDLEKKQLTVKRRIEPTKGKRYPIESSRQERTLPLPDFVIDYITRINAGEEVQDAFVYTGNDQFADIYVASLTFRRIVKQCLHITVVSPDSLRSTFIRQILESGINIETASELTGLDKNVLYKRYPLSIKAHTEALLKMGNPYAGDGVRQAETNLEDKQSPAELNLLIFGAGSHGHAVMEEAEKLGIFQEIKFLDDHITGDNILGKCSELMNFKERFPAAFIAIGNNERRKYYAEMAMKAGFLCPRIISREASIAQNAQIGIGTIVMPQATISGNAKVGDFCLLASNSLVSFHAEVKAYVHCDCGSIVMKDSTAEELTYIGSGEVYRG